MHKIFGIKNNVDYIEREGLEEAGYKVYVGEIISKVAEPMETDHKFVWVGYDEIKGKLFVEMQNWALEQCFKLYLSANAFDN